MQNILHKTRFVQYSLIKIIGEIMFFGVPIILAKFMTQEDFGRYSLGTMIIYFFTSITISSFKTPFIKYASEELKKTNKINSTFSVAVAFATITLIVFVVIMYLSKSYILSFTDLNPNLYPLFIGCFFGFTALYLAEAFFMAINRRIKSSFYTFISASIAFIYVIIAFVVGKAEIKYTFLALFISPILALFFVISRKDIALARPFNWNKALFKKMIKFTGWVTFGNSAVYLINWGDNLVLKRLVSLAEIGIYNLGYQIFKSVIVFLSTISNYFLPSVSRNIGNKGYIKNFLNKKRPLITMAGISILVLLFFALPPIIRWFYGTDYLGSIKIAQILLVASAFALHRRFYEPILYAMEKYRFIQITYIISVVVNLTLDYVFILKWGYVGAAFATTTSYFLMSCLFEIYFRKKCSNQLNLSEPS